MIALVDGTIMIKDQRKCYAEFISRQAQSGRAHNPPAHRYQ